MPSYKNYGLLIALGVATALVFQNYSETPGQMMLQPCEDEPDSTDPDGFQSSTEKPETVAPAMQDPRCTQQWCGGPNNSALYRELKELSSKYKGLFVTRTEIFKMNWCLANPDRCPNGEFPTEGPEADIVRQHSAAYDTLLPSSVDPNLRDEWFRPTKMGTLTVDSYVDNDRCCQTNIIYKQITGEMKDRHNRLTYIPSIDLLFQVVSEGTCHGSSKTEGCSRYVNCGQCKQQYKQVGLFGYDIVLKQTINSWVKVNAYCSCIYTKGD